MTNSQSLTENLIDCIVALGAPRPASMGLTELYQAFAAALGSAGGGANGVKPSGDTTGLTDYNNIQTALNAGGVILAPGLFYINHQLIIPDGTNSTLPAGYLYGSGLAVTTIRVVSGTNLSGPAITTANWALTSASVAPSMSYVPVFVRDFTLDMNVINQSYAANPTWAGVTASSGGQSLPVTGPDGLTICNPCAEIDRVRVINPVRHGFVDADETAGSGLATSNAYDQRWTDCRVDGYFIVSGVSAPTATCATTSGSTTVTVSGSVPANVKIGSVVVGAGIVPNTAVLNILGTTLTISQPATLTQGSVTLTFGLGMRGFWNTDFSNGCNDSYFSGFIARDLYGDLMLAFDTAGGWTITDPHTYGQPFSGWRFLFAETATIKMGEGPDNIDGLAPTARCVLNGALTAATYTGFNCQSLPTKMRAGTLLVIPGGGPAGAPLYAMTTIFTAAGATSIQTTPFTVTTTVANASVFYQPIVGIEVSSNSNPGPIGQGIVVGDEISTGHYVYVLLSAHQSTGTVANVVNSICCQNQAVAGGATSTAAVFISFGATWNVYGAETIVVLGNAADTPIALPYFANSAAVNLVTGTPGETVPA